MPTPLSNRSGRSSNDRRAECKARWRDWQEMFARNSISQSRKHRACHEPRARKKIHQRFVHTIEVIVDEVWTAILSPLAQFLPITREYRYSRGPKFASPGSSPEKIFFDGRIWL